ncbi:MAG: BtpA/SgcQ family protein [Roseobacter sp.]
MSLSMFASDPPVIAALHLPDFALTRDKSVTWYEDYAIANARVFADAGVPFVKLQDQTRTAEAVAPDTLTMMASLGRLIRAEFPALRLGIIIEAHDPTAALCVAHAVGADFVRLKVFAGGAMTAEGPRYGLGAATVQCRAQLGCREIAILADVHDRTARPLSDESQPFAAGWAVKAGADGLVVTGGSFPDTLERISKMRETVATKPILIGGGVTSDNVSAALAASDGVVVSSALMKRDMGPDDLTRWDIDTCRRFMDAART